MISSGARPAIKSLEGLRGVLALLVCFGHFGLNNALEKHHVHVDYGLSVDVFFALSAFVLCYTNYFGAKTLWRFTLGRLARLYPLYIVTTLLMWALLPGAASFTSLATLAEEVFWLHNVGLPPDTPAHNFPSWSISVEFWASLLFFFYMSRKTNRLLPTVLILLACVFAMGSNLDGDRFVLAYISTSLIRGVAGFSCGALAYLVYDRLERGPQSGRALVYAALALMAACFFIPGWSVVASLLFYGAVFALLVLLARYDDATLLSSRPFVFLGAISYSIYLLHRPVYAVLAAAIGDGDVRGGMKLVLVLPAILAASYGSTRFFERPLQRWILALGAGSGAAPGRATLTSPPPAPDRGLTIP